MEKRTKSKFPGLADRISMRMKSLGISQIDLARRADIKQNTLSDLEKGKSKSISGETLAKLCRELRLTAEYLLFGGLEPGGSDLQMSEAEAVYILRMLPPESRETFLNLGRALLSPSPPLLPRGPKTAGQADDRRH